MANHPSSNPCPKSEQLLSRMESSLLPAMPHSQNQLLSSSESIQSYYSNISKKKHCGPGKSASHFIWHLWSSHSAASFGDMLFAAASIPLPPTWSTQCTYTLSVLHSPSASVPLSFGNSSYFLLGLSLNCIQLKASLRPCTNFNTSKGSFGSDHHISLTI